MVVSSILVIEGMGEATNEVLPMSSVKWFIFIQLQNHPILSFGKGGVTAEALEMISNLLVDTNNNQLTNKQR